MKICSTRRCILGALGAAAAGLGVMAADRDPPFVRRGGFIDPPVAMRASRAEVHWDADAVRDCPGTIVRSITDWKGEVWALPSSIARYAKVSKDKPLSDIWIPMGAACRQMPGFKEAGSPKARYNARASYACPWNPLHKLFPIIVDKPDIQFDIDC